MNWTNKLYGLRTEALIELGRVLVKGYDKTELDNQEQLYLPCIVYYGKSGSEIFSLIYWDKEEEYFTGKSWDTGDYYYFQLIELDTQCICNLIDIINEQNKV